MESATTKAKLGQRWVCFKCNARFYDLNKPEPICPKCSANQQESPAFQKPGKKRPAKKAPAAAAVPKKEAAPPPAEDIEMRRDEEIEDEFSEEGEFDLEDLELEDGGGGDDDSVGLVEVEED